MWWQLFLLWQKVSRTFTCCLSINPCGDEYLNWTIYTQFITLSFYTSHFVYLYLASCCFSISWIHHWIFISIFYVYASLPGLANSITLVIIIYTVPGYYTSVDSHTFCEKVWEKKCLYMCQKNPGFVSCSKINSQKKVPIFSETSAGTRKNATWFMANNIIKCWINIHSHTIQQSLVKFWVSMVSDMHTLCL